MFHQDIYGSGYDHSDSDGIVLRTQLTPVIDKQIQMQFFRDMTIHIQEISDNIRWFRAQFIYKGTIFINAEAFSSYLKDNLCYTLTTGSDDTTKAIDPKGTVYFEANSATGSKYYQLIGTQQDYIAARCQSWRPTYSVIDITEQHLL